MSRRLLLFLAVLAFLILCIWCVWGFLGTGGHARTMLARQQQAQQDLGVRHRQVCEDVKAQIVMSGYSGLMVKCRGFDIRLQNRVPDEAARIRVEELVRQVEGVDRITNDLVVAPPRALVPPGSISASSEPVGNLAFLEIQPSGEGVTLRGQVPRDADRIALIEAATARLGANRVTDQLRIDDSLSSLGDLGDLGALADLAAGALQGGSLRIQGQEARLAGRVLSEEAKKSIGQRFTDLLAGYSLVNGLRVDEGGAAARTQEGLNVVLAGRTIEFETSSDRITARGRAILDQMTRILTQPDAPRVEVGGHTDSRGDQGMNQRLSERRAAAVVAYLTQAGVDPGKLDPMGYGEGKPIADNGTELGRRRNRRIEFRVLEEG